MTAQSAIDAFSMSRLVRSLSDWPVTHWRLAFLGPAGKRSSNRQRKRLNERTEQLAACSRGCLVCIDEDAALIG